MKKVALLGVIALSITSSVMADNFTGFALGAEVGSGKHNFQILNEDFEVSGSKAKNLSVFARYGFDFAGNFVGMPEIKLGTGGSKTQNKWGETVSKEKYNFSIAYLQGYRITDSILPYVKIGAKISSFDVNEEAIQRAIGSYRRVEIEGSSLFGVTYGGGVKFAFNENVELGIEYTKTKLRNINSDVKAQSNNIGFNVAYRF